MYLLQLSELVAGALCQVPIGLQEVVVHLVNQDTRHRPSARTLVQISYFGSVYERVAVGRKYPCTRPL